MNGRKQKISKETCLQTVRTESGGNAGGQTFLWITENNPTHVNNLKGGLLEQILSPTNMNEAYKKVKRNHGSGGVDKMDVESLKDYLIENKEALIQTILKGTYRPNPVRRVEIPKDKGSVRKLGIPTVVDRCIQQAIQQILSPIFEKQFSESSFGFRPKRSAHQALKRCLDHMNDGYRYAVDLDLEKFFDTVNQSKLIEVLSRTIQDGRVISLIHKYLNAGVVVGNKFEATLLGVPQGGPLSPLLSNIMLNELDKELEKRGHRFVRYADDVVILCKSIRSAERTFMNILPFIEGNLFLKVNKEKTVIGYVTQIKFLGYAFYVHEKGVRLLVHEKSISKMKERIKLFTSRSNGWGDSKRKERLKSFIMGWVNYFKLADMKGLLSKIDEWYRRRLRMVIWKQWKRNITRFRNLMKLGLPKSKSWEFANTRKSYWHTAKSHILHTSVTNVRLKQAGYLFFSDYLKIVYDII